jgi:hypothetical protein
MSLLPTPKKPVNYLNNKDILKEIHTSKNTYCVFANPDSDHRYDYIIDMPQSTLAESFAQALTPEVVQEAKVNHAVKLDIDQGLSKGTTDPLTIPTTDLIFRIMTWDHIPVAPKQPRKTDKKKTAKDIFEFDENADDILAELEDPTTQKEVDDMVHVKVNFPPFQHFKINEKNEFFCIGKSHWIGELETGEFSKDQGNITNKLARMYIMMCEKYAMKFNWRGYTYNDEMRNSAILQLTYVGLRFNEAKSANPFAYYTAAITNSFCRVLNSEKRNQNIRDDILEINGLNPSWTRQGTGAGAPSFEE